jgi:hypothetical protein
VPGLLVHVGATVTCQHGGQAQPTAPNPRVLVSGQPTVAVTAPWLVAGCGLPPPPAGNGPCVTGQWVTSATRVTSGGQPLLLFDGQAVCAPSGTGLLVMTTQTRAAGV